MLSIRITRPGTEDLIHLIRFQIFKGSSGSMTMTIDIAKHTKTIITPIGGAVISIMPHQSILVPLSSPVSLCA